MKKVNFQDDNNYSNNLQVENNYDEPAKVDNDIINTDEAVNEKYNVIDKNKRIKFILITVIIILIMFSLMIVNLLLTRTQESENVDSTVTYSSENEETSDSTTENEKTSASAAENEESTEELTTSETTTERVVSTLNVIGTWKIADTNVTLSLKNDNTFVYRTKNDKKLVYSGDVSIRQRFSACSKVNMDINEAMNLFHCDSAEFNTMNLYYIECNATTYSVDGGTAQKNKCY